MTVTPPSQGPTGVGRPVPVRFPLATATETSMWLDEVVVYPEGVTFRICANGEAAFETQWPATEDVVDVVVTLPSGERLVGAVVPVMAGAHQRVEGRVAARRAGARDAVLVPVAFVSVGGGWTQTFWLSPLPATGTVAVAVTWGSRDVGAATARLGVEELRRYLR